jgi:DNA-binding transcriptional regulator PaaX
VHKKIIYLSGDEVKLTKRGQELLKIIQLKDLAIIRPKNWDHIWHLVSYDIPEFKKKERDFFRSKLIALGFGQIQDSLWAYPYECCKVPNF